MEYCICGHPKNIHKKLYWEDIELVGTDCLGNYKSGGYCTCENFKLDNLKFIEDAAKEKGLL